MKEILYQYHIDNIIIISLIKKQRLDRNMSIPIFTALSLHLIIVFAYSSTFIKQQQSLQLPSSINFNIHQCGYGYPSIISFQNGTINLWKNQTLQLNQSHQIKCFLSSDVINSNIRFIAIFNPHVSISQHEHILYYNKIDHLQPIQWKPSKIPFPQNSKIQQIQISVQRIALIIQKGPLKCIQVYNTQNLLQIYNRDLLHTDRYYQNIIKLDTLNNLLIYSKYYKILQVKYGKNLQSKIQFNFINISSYVIIGISNVDLYSRTNRVSNFVFDFVDSSPLGEMVSITVEISLLKYVNEHEDKQYRYIQYQDQIQNQSVFQLITQNPPIQVHITNNQTYPKSQQKLYCNDRTFIFDYDTKCVKQYNQCIIDKVPVYGEACASDYQNTANGVSRVKLVMVFANHDGSAKHIQVYEEDRDQSYLVYIILAVVVFIAMLIVFITCLRKKWIKFPGKGKRSAINEENLNDYVNMQDN